MWNYSLFSFLIRNNKIIKEKLMQNKTPVKIYYLKNNKTINHLSQKNYQSDSIFP